MFEDLIKRLQRPEKFKRSDKMFWKDPHISKYLLEAHLNPNHEAASRNPDFIDKSVQFIEETATKKEDRKIIDFGCGPGLYCERLANRGYDVTGIDFSENSIEYAREHAKDNGLHITYRYENYLHFTDENKYDFALLIYCDYGALGHVNRSQLLQNIWRSLQAGGRLLLDVFTDFKYNQFLESNSWYVKEEGGFWASEAHIELNQNLKYKECTTLEQTTIITNQKTETYNIWHQHFTKEMIVHELEAAGFKIISIHNDVTGEKYFAGNETLALLVEK